MPGSHNLCDSVSKVHDTQEMALHRVKGQDSVPVRDSTDQLHRSLILTHCLQKWLKAYALCISTRQGFVVFLPWYFLCLQPFETQGLPGLSMFSMDLITMTVFFF